MKRCLEHTWTRGSMNDLFERCRWCGETRKLPSKAPSSPVETTAGEKGTELRPCDSEALTERERQGFKAAIAQRDATITEALARIERLWDVIAANGATNARLMSERDKARGEVVGSERELDRVRAERDAANTEANQLTGRDKWADMGGQMTPHNDPEPNECCASGRCEVCCPGYVWGRDG